MILCGIDANKLVLIDLLTLVQNVLFALLATMSWNRVSRKTRFQFSLPENYAITF